MSVVVTIELDVEKPEATITCDDCGKQSRAYDVATTLNETGTALTPGDPVPAGRCPHCYYLVYPAEVTS